jgi:hypothetical protein
MWRMSCKTLAATSGSENIEEAPISHRTLDIWQVGFGVGYGSKVAVGLADRTSAFRRDPNVRFWRIAAVRTAVTTDQTGRAE